MLGKILTIDNLKKSGPILVDWCYLCKESGESSDHLLLHCKVARELWDLVFVLFGVQWVMPRTVLDLFFPVGRGPVVVVGVPRCGGLFLTVFFGVFGWKETLGTLRILRNPFRI